jgi:phage-related protein
VKNIAFHPAALKEIQKFPVTVKKELGKALLELQYNAKLSMPLSRPMSSVSRGVEELRLKDASGVYRVFYLTRLEDKVLVFHAFKKKTQKTPKQEIETGRKRLKELLDG